MLEWTDDLEAFILKGYGKALNYRMGVPLLKDVVQSMDQAIEAHEGTYLNFKKRSMMSGFFSLFYNHSFE